MQQNINKEAMVKGLIIGAMLILKFILGVLNITAMGFVSSIVSILIVVVLYLFAVSYRDKVKEGFISYKNAFGLIFLTYFFGAIILSLFLLLYTSNIQPEYLSNIFNTTLNLYEQINIPMTDEAISLMETIYSPAPFAILNIFSSGLVALFWALILAAFVKKQKNIFE